MPSVSKDKRERLNLVLWRVVFGFVFFLSFYFSTFNRAEASVIALEGPYSIIINVEALKCCEGVLRVALYPQGAKWLSKSGMARGRIGMIESDNARVEIHGLPAGVYAIAVHQDLNNDGKLNRRLGLIPREPYGFSNNVGKYGPASFDKASFTLDGDIEMTIRMHGGKK